MSKQLSKLYEPQDVEDRIYQYWLDEGCFQAKIDPAKPSYTIVIPPPNITGQLHMGHALDETFQDILIRWKRMQGYSALWLPGTDHASIATEAKIVEEMKKEGLTKEDLGRDGFLERAWAWKDKYAGRIVEQLKKLGSSCDWSRLRFTLDEGCSQAVKEVFVRLYEKGLIYRGERIVNWCPCCRTSISDAEVEYEDQQGFFWHLKYPFADGSGYLELATTRPETMAGDTAVAVHPEDERYRGAIGKKVLLPLFGREIPVVADEYVDREFGTGVVKITPAHDPNDFEVGRRHGLEIMNVMTEDGHMNEKAGKYAGMDRYEARKAMVADLEAEGCLLSTEPHAHNVGTCYRCGTTVEPRVSKQWFVKMEPLAGPALDVVKNGEIQFVPERMTKIYHNWMENIKDWCISRQLWWGHRIPAWYCAGCGEVTVSKEAPAECGHCHGTHLEQDPDTLDTWFSSALWPFSTLGWPEKTPELDYFYPTAALVTGYDIIFFWVARMIFSGLEHMGQPPFRTVLFHGLVRDSQGRKMSKSLGNGIDPLDVVSQYGADALRFTLATGNTPGNDMRYSEDRVKSSRNFANKLWNAARYVMMNLPEGFRLDGLPSDLATEDKWVLSKCNELARAVNENMEKFELGIAVQKLYDFIWDVYCDWYIELTKPRIQAGGQTAANAQAVLVWVMEAMLKLLHPYMPFVTEEIWQTLQELQGLDGKQNPLMLAKFPEYDPALCFPQEEQEFGKVMEAIKAVRNRRAEMNVPPSKKAALFVETKETAVFQAGELFFQRLASASAVTVTERYEAAGGEITVVSDSARIFIPMEELVDRKKELERLEKEREAAVKEISFLEQKLSNPGFTAKAPAKLVEDQKSRLAKAKEKLEKIEASITAMNS